MLKRISVLCLSFIIIVFGCQSEEKPDFSNTLPTHHLLKMLPIPSGLGVNIHFYNGNKNDLKMLKDAGVGIVRMDVSWSDIEKLKGQYDFSHHDKLVKDLDSLGISILFIIDYGNLLYDDGLAPNSENGREAYKKFCSALAQHYSGKNIIWELWNEPNIDKFWQPKVNVDDYMKFCHTVVPAIRAKDKDACIIAPAMSSFDMKFMESCFQQGLLNLVDGVSVHPYRNSHLSPETAFDEYQLLSILINQYKPREKAIPILSGEWGYTTADATRKLQGKYLARQWLSNLANDIPISIWYDWHDDGKDPKEAEHNFGTVTWDYKEKPSYVAMKTFINHFKGYKTLGRISLDSLADYMLIFQKEEKIRIAIWTTASKHFISLGKDLLLSQGINYLGKTLSKIDDGKIEISDEPIYLDLQSPYPAWIRLITRIYNLTFTEANNVSNSIIQNDKKNKLGNTILSFLNAENPLNSNAALYSLNELARKIKRDESLNLYHLILESSSETLSNKKALIEITKISSEKSMKYVTPKLKDSHLMTEASLYFLTLAYKMVKDEKFVNAIKLLTRTVKYTPPRYAVDRIIEKIKNKGKNIDSKIFNQMAKSSGFINDWNVIGPFPYRKKSDRTVEYLSAELLDTSKSIQFNNSIRRWINIKSDGVFPVISFAEIYGRKKSIAYAYTEINLRKNIAAILKIGSNDGVACWVNSKMIYENYIGRALTIDEDLVKVHLQKGKNRILLKVVNEGNNWEVCLRICDSDGKPIDLSHMKK